VLGVVLLDAKPFCPHPNLYHHKRLVMSPFGALTTKALLSEIESDVRYFNILLRSVLSSNLEDHLLLVLRNGLLADGLYKFAQPKNVVSMSLETQGE